MKFVSSIRLDETIESLVFKGALTKRIFELYIGKAFALYWREDDIFIMDNLSSPEFYRKDVV